MGGSLAKSKIKIFPPTLKELIASSRYLRILNVREALFLLVLTFFGVLFEGVSIAMLLPILEFIESGENVLSLAKTSFLWWGIVRYHGVLHVDVSLLSLMLSVVVLVIARQILDYAKRTYSMSVSESSLIRIRERGFQAYLKADLKFLSHHNVGTLINTLILDGTNASGVTMGLIQMIGYFALISAYITCLLFINSVATLITGTILLVTGLTFFKLLRKSKRYGAITTEYNKKLGEILVERLSAVRLIKLVASYARESAEYSRIVKTLFTQRLKIARLKALIDSFLQMTVLLSAFAIIYVSTEIFRMSISQVSIFVFVLLRLMPLAQEFFAQTQTVLTSVSGLLSVRSVIEKAERGNTICGGGRIFTGIRDKLVFDDVCFRYEEALPPVLKNVSLAIPAFKMTAIVGRSGAGKSTLADLLPRLIVPQSGTIAVDGVPLAEFSLESLRTGIAFVSQEDFLFDASVLENIRYGRPDASADEVVWAARCAYIADFVESLPEKYATQIGERGVRLSGGQKQRIVLARALLRKAPVIVLDEPTSALDSESERYIQKAIEDIRRDGATTLIVIAHRLSTIRSADQILVLDGGRVVEAGAHQELMHGDDWYSDMFKIQAGRATV